MKCLPVCEHSRLAAAYDNVVSFGRRHLYGELVFIDCALDFVLGPTKCVKLARRMNAVSFDHGHTVSEHYLPRRREHPTRLHLCLRRPCRAQRIRGLMTRGLE